jgi:hypothetical protein
MTSVPSPVPAGAPQNDDGALPPNYGVGRVCVAVGCRTELSRYRESTLCEKHARAARASRILDEG